MPPATSPWNDEKDEELRRLWAEGYSAKEIAEALKIGVTRCAVLGKVNRLGLPLRKPAPPPPKPVKPVVLRRIFRPAPRKERRVLQETPVEVSKPRRLQLVQLEDDHCRWPIGDPRGKRFFFCAA